MDVLGQTGQIRDPGTLQRLQIAQQKGEAEKQLETKGQMETCYLEMLMTCLSKESRPCSSCEAQQNREP